MAKTDFIGKKYNVTSRTIAKIVLFVLLLAGVGVGFYLFPRARPIESYLTRAEEAFQDRNFNRAIEFYLKALKYYPKHEKTPEVLLQVGDIYNFSLGNSEKAGKAYELLAKDYPKSPHTLVGLNHAGEMYEKNDQFQPALLAYQGIIDQFPENPNLDEMRFKVAMMALKIKKYEPARRALMAIIENNPETPIADKVLYQIGNTFFMEGGNREAVQVLRVAIEKYPQSPLIVEMKFSLANALEEVGELAEALKIYRAILSLYPNPKVIEKKIEKISKKNVEAIKIHQKMADQAKKNQQTMMKGATPAKETQPKGGKSKKVDSHFLDPLPDFPF